MVSCGMCVVFAKLRIVFFFGGADMRNSSKEGFRRDYTGS